MRQYESIVQYAKDDAEKLLKTEDRNQLCKVLLGLSEIDDWEWVQEKYLSFLNNDDVWVSSAAIAGLGDLARINGQIDKARVKSELHSLRISRPELEGKIGDALSDIDIYVK